MKYGIKLCGLFLGTSLLVACGGNNEGSNDGSNGNTTHNTVVQVSPTNGATKISVISNITVTFEAPISLTEFNSLGAKLTPADINEPGFGKIGSASLGNVPFQVSVSGNVVTIDPSVPLEYGTEYTFSVGDQNYTFKTYLNRIENNINYDSSGNVFFYTQYSNSEFAADWTEYNGAGSDGVWLTQDDNVYQQLVHELNSDNRIVRTLLSDFIALRNVDEYSYNSDGLVTQRTTFVRDVSEGTDGVLGTDDDIPDSYYSYNYTQNENVVIFYTGPGTDSIWFSDDDNIELYTLEKLNDLGFKTFDYSFNGSGLDGVWGTNDDSFSFGQSFQYNGDGNLTVTSDMSSTGVDLTPFTSDDEKLNVLAIEYNGLLMDTAKLLTGSGSDGQWLTSDDDERKRNFYQYNEHGQLTQYLAQYKGDDGLYDTEDDRIFKRTITYDSNGNRDEIIIEVDNYFGDGLNYVAVTQKFDTTL
jgi:hypothetical protein